MRPHGKTTESAAFRAGEGIDLRNIPTAAEDIKPARGRVSRDTDRLLLLRREVRCLSDLAACRRLRQSCAGSGRAIAAAWICRRHSGAQDEEQNGEAQKKRPRRAHGRNSE